MNVSKSLLLVLVLAACGGEDPAMTSETSSGPAADTGPDACIPGYEGCACVEGGCLDGLECLSDLCVAELPDPSESSTDPDPTDPDPTDPGTTEPITTSDGSSSEGSSSAAHDDSSDASSSTGAVPTCLDGDNYCMDSDLQTCVDGEWEYRGCEEVCADSGYLTTGCANADQCYCDGFFDDRCYTGAYALCLCADIDFNIPCTDEQLLIFYDECWNEVNTYVECFADYSPIQQGADCQAPEDACL